MIARVVLLFALIAAAFAAELTHMTELAASAGSHTLTIAQVALPGAYAQDGSVTAGFTRGYNGGVPGPTFRMAPGETLSVTLQNDLLASRSKTCAETNSEYCKASYTNLHTHGLHVTSKGIDDGLAAHSDNIFAVVAPGASANYAFAIPAYHMGGTHWYHPHHHHSTGLQAGGGAAGMLIVEDPAGYLPDVYANMVEKLLFFSCHNLNTLQTMATASQSELLTTANTEATTDGLDTNIFFTNGQLGTDTEMTVASHTWHRFRMLFAAVEQQLDITITTATNGAACQWFLLAKDGVYLNTVPRTIVDVVLFPGARSDVAVSCTCTTYPCTATMGSAAAARRSGRSGGMGGGGRKLQQTAKGPGAAAADQAATVTLLTLSITETAGGTVETLPAWTPERPCYLADLTTVDVGTNTGAMDLNGGGRVVRWDGQGTSMTYAAIEAQGGDMNTWPALTTWQAGTVHEAVVTGTNAHPLHIHVNPFQITAMPAATYNNDYFLVGDWHDTLMIPDTGGGTTVSVRMNTDVFTGKYVVHCHILEHEDEGMMAWIQVDGTEGATYTPPAPVPTPSNGWVGFGTCYNTAYGGTTPTPAPTAAPTETGATPSPTSPTATPTPAPTPAPTPTPYTANFVVSVEGITAAQFDTSARTSFKTVVANNAGSICGTDGATACHANDVTITGYVRRTAAVTFTLTTYSETNANSAVSTLETYMATAAFTTALTNSGGNLMQVTSTAVTSSTTTVATPAPTAAPTAASSGDDDSSSDDSTIIIVCVVAGIVVLLCVAAAIYVAYVMAHASRARDLKDTDVETGTEMSAPTDSNIAGVVPGATSDTTSDTTSKVTE